MRILFAVAVVAASLRVARPLSEGAANCPVAGNWSNAEGTKTLRVQRPEQQGNTSEANPVLASMTTYLELNMSDYRFVHESMNANKPQTIYSGMAFLVVLANASGPYGYSNTEQTVLELLCANDILFVDILPPVDMAPEEASFSLRRLVAAPLSEALQDRTIPSSSSSSSSSSPSSPGISPQFILVNITLATPQEGESQGNGKMAPQRNLDEASDASFREEDLQ